MPDSSGKGSFNKSKDAKSPTQDCPLSKALECDYNGLKLAFQSPSASASCQESRHQRDMSVITQTYANKSDSKFKKIHDYDTILEVAVPALTTGQTKKFSFTVAPILGQGPCDKHGGMDIRVKNMDPNDTLFANRNNVRVSEQYFVYGKHTQADNNIAKTNGFLGFLWMFVDTAAPAYIKEADFSLNSCGARTDGKQPNGPLKGLVRVYRDDRFTLSFNVKSRYQYGVGGKASSDGKSSTYLMDGGTKNTSKYEGPQLVGLKEEKFNLLKNETYALDKNANVVKPKDWVPANDKVFVLKRNGHEVDASKVVNKVFEIKEMVQDGIDFVKEIKDSIPKAGISGDLSVDFLFGTIEASWGLSQSEHSTAEYVWVEPDFKGSFKLTIIQIEGKIKAGIESASPAFLNWWGAKAWDFELSFSLGINGSISLSGAMTIASGTIQSDAGSVFEQKSVIPGCEYKGNKGKEKHILTAEGEIKPICSGLAKVNVMGVGAEAKINLNGALKISAALVWPFDIRYQGVLEQGEVVFTYEAANKPPSRPDPLKVWDKKDDLIKENYAFGGRL